MLCFNGKHKKNGEQGSGEIAILDKKKVWPGVVVEGMCCFSFFPCAVSSFVFRALINGKKRSQENVEKQKGWRLVEMKEDGSDFCFVCLFVCQMVQFRYERERERERERETVRWGCG